MKEKNSASFVPQPMENTTYVLSFVLSTGKCKVDNTEKGWFIAYIDRDPETLARQKVALLQLIIFLKFL